MRAAAAMGGEPPGAATRLDQAARLARGRIADPPYPGIRPFEEQEWPIFFGRQAIVDELLGRLGSNRFVAVLGASGGGKSSLIRAGLFATLKHKHARLGVRWRTATMRPAGSPMWSLAEALHRALHPQHSGEQIRTPPVDELIPLRARLAMGAHAIAAVLKEEKFPEDHNLLLLVDQFEELFRYDVLGGAAEVQSFLDQLVNVVERPPEGFYLALTMRSDFLGECARFPHFAEALNRSGYLLRRMTEGEIEEAIVRPAQLLGGTIEPALVQRLIRDARSAQDHLPLLQHALMWLWGLERERLRANSAGDAPVVLRLADYEAMRGMDGALSQHASAIYDDLGDRSSDDASQRTRLQDAAKRIFLALTDVDQHGRVVRRPVRFAQLAEEARVPPEDLRAVIEAFRAPAESFLMPPAPIALEDDKVVDVSHEALIRNWHHLRGWIEENGEFLQTKDRVIRAAMHWEAMARDPTLLLPRGRALAEAQDILIERRSDLAPDLIEFIETSISAKRAQDEAEQKAQEERIEARSEIERQHLQLQKLAAEHEAEHQQIERERVEANAIRERETAARRLAWRTRVAAFGMAVLALLAAGFGWYAMKQAGEAKRQAAIIQSLRLTSLSEQATTSGNATNGILLALEALPHGADDQRPYDSGAALALFDAILKHRELAVLRGHDKSVLSAAFSADGSRVVTASDDETALVWDAGTGEPAAVLRGHRGVVKSAAFSTDGSRVVTASADKTARVWDAGTGKQLLELSGHDDEVWSAAFNADGSRVVTASKDGTARIWEAGTGKQLFELSGDGNAALPGRGREIRSAVFSADGSRVVTASSDGTARIWEVSTGRQVAVLVGHSDSVLSAAFSADGSRVVTASSDNTAWLWDAGTGKMVAVLRGHGSAVLSAAFSQDGTRVVTASDDNTARLWDAGTGKEVAVLRGHEDGVKSALFSADGSRVVTASSDKTARLWDAATGKETDVFRGHEEAVRLAAFSADGSRVVTASDDKTARLWDAGMGKEVAVLRGHKGWVTAAAFSADGSRVVTASKDGTWRLWDAGTGKELHELRGHKGAVNLAAFSADGSRVVTASSDGTAMVWEAGRGGLVAVLRRHEDAVNSAVYSRGHKDAVNSAVFSKDGSRVVTASDDNTARLWDAGTGKELRKLRHEGKVISAAFSADGSRVVTASDDKTARLWDTGTGKELHVLSGHTDRVGSAAFSADGSRVVTASADETARLWDTGTGKELHVLSGHTDRVRSAAFSADGSRVVTASSDGTARLWEASTGKPVAVLRGHDGAVRSAAFNADGSRVVTASSDGTARLWKADTGEELVVFRGHEGGVRSAAFSADGSHVVTASDDGSARIWPVFPTTEALVAYVNNIVPRQLTPQERQRYFLETAESSP